MGPVTSAPAHCGGLRAPALNSQGRIWFGEPEFGRIGLFDPLTETWKSWRAPTPGGRPIEIYSFMRGLDTHQASA